MLREDRLGTLMLRTQRIWSDGSVNFAFAPKVASPPAIATGPQSGLGPQFDRTNGSDRLLFSLNYDVAELNPQALVFRDGGRTKFGLNLSQPVGQSIIAYGEWAGGRQRSLIAEAIDYGKRTGRLPAAAPVLPPADNSDRFRNDLAAGASWTSSAKVTVNLEYHFHQAGLSRQDWHNWFAAGAAQPNALPVIGELWLTRGFAADQQQPTTRHQVFLRADWTDALISQLELTALAFVNLTDGSSLTQLSAVYHQSDAWSFGVYATGDLGSRRSERGSLPLAASATLQAIRYF